MTAVRSTPDQAPETGSFRDPSGQIYIVDGRVLRGVNAQTAADLSALLELDFFSNAVRARNIVETRPVQTPPGKFPSSFGDQPWAQFFEHQAIPFVTYPYEWTFSMLRDAALLQLRLLENALENGWMLKDATPYNIQFTGSKPTFIDVASFEPWVKGEPWAGYRQFCNMFLFPLMLKSYLGIDHTRILRSHLDGISAMEVARMLRGAARFKPGVLSHVLFPARVEASIAKRERNAVAAKRRRAPHQSKAMIVGLVQSLQRLILRMGTSDAQTNWSHYDQTHTYSEPDFEQKKSFVQRHVGATQHQVIWDIGSNTGTFSRLCAPFAEQVIAIDGDQEAVDMLYRAEKNAAQSNILPLVMDLANLSPGQGWAGCERKAFDKRTMPDLVISLALIHHLRISANVPVAMFLDWLRALGSTVILEFVDRHDEMVEKLLTNKKEQYDDYNKDAFQRAVEDRFVIRESKDLKGGRRTIYMLSPDH